MIMYRSSAYSSILTTSMMSPELLEVFDTEADLRYKFNFTTLGWDGEPSGDPYPAILPDLDYNIGVPEMMLIKAECLARKNDPEALNILNTLRKKRIAADKYADLPQVSACLVYTSWNTPCQPSRGCRNGTRCRSREEGSTRSCWMMERKFG